MKQESVSDWNWVYQQLLAQWGAQHWWPAKTPFEVMVGAILTQNTAWTNVEKAIARLESADLLDVGRILDSDDANLETCLHPSGYYRVKARRLRSLCAFLQEEGCAERPESLRERGSLPELRRKLLGVHGIGEETADSILLYALQLPVMVVDAYTKRIAIRLAWCEERVRYAEIQRDIESALMHGDVELRKELHALLVELGKNICRPRRPICSQCPLSRRCAYGVDQARPGN
ncbi:endonuclease [Acidithiobacillus sp. AMEEHan]|uniref:endonuclease III domain-containing protein n=1 Tax=Acidithiobacillus sp. AMEEHan TaxID=2994951 RepID=UPI0027E50B15|nr:endonuclease [Acidithiobacillus sp. AMEEHan]